MLSPKFLSPVIPTPPHLEYHINILKMGKGRTHESALLLTEMFISLNKLEVPAIEDCGLSKSLCCASLDRLIRRPPPDIATVFDLVININFGARSE
jgi:hypothetical protein